MFCLLLMLLFGSLALDTLFSFFVLSSTAKHFQSLSVSSAAPDTTVDPSGLIAMWRMRDVCPGDGGRGVGKKKRIVRGSTVVKRDLNRTGKIKIFKTFAHFIDKRMTILPATPI